MSVHGHPKKQAVLHVLTTARACAAKWRTWSYPHMPSECRDLVDAVDVLDEPLERYYAGGERGEYLYERGNDKDRQLGMAWTKGDAEKIATALNASEAQS